MHYISRTSLMQLENQNRYILTSLLDIKSTLLVQLGNIAQRVGHSLNIDNQNGRIMYDSEAMKYWSRSYEPGWEMKL